MPDGLGVELEVDEVGDGVGGVGQEEQPERPASAVSTAARGDGRGARPPTG